MMTTQLYLALEDYRDADSGFRYHSDRLSQETDPIKRRLRLMLADRYGRIRAACADRVSFYSESNTYGCRV